MRNIAILASGNGSNAESIIRYFSSHPDCKVVSVLANNANAGVLDRAQNLGVEATYFSKDSFKEADNIVAFLSDRNVELIVLAGFLQLIPQAFIQRFSIVNIHPSLLPKFGGKGMYGINIHRAVVENKETESGITIHEVNEKFDDGNILFQKTCPVYPNDTPEEVAQRVLKIEHEWFPRVIESFLLKTELISS